MNNNGVIKGVAVTVGIIFFLFFFGSRLLIQNDSLLGERAGDFRDVIKEKSGFGIASDATPEVKSILNGLVRYIDQKKGKGKKVVEDSIVVIRYVGYLQNGQQFSATEEDKPITFKLGKGEVIQGIDAGMQGMRVGGIRLIELAPEAAYGDKEYGGIPANSVLVFAIELVEVKE